MVDEPALRRHGLPRTCGGFGELLARRLGVGHQFFRHFDIAPAGRPQQRGKLVLLAGGAGDHGVVQILGRREYADDEAGQRQRLGQARQRFRRHRADLQFEKALVSAQNRQIEIEGGEAVQRLQHAGDAPRILFLAAQGIVFAKADLPQLAEEVVYVGQLLQAHRFQGFLGRIGRQLSAAVQQFGKARARRQV